MTTFRQLRILILLLVLALVAASAWLTKLRSTDWDSPLVVAIYPINADGSAVSGAYIDQLLLDQFAAIETFFRDEAGHYELALAEPVALVLGPVLEELPPQPPADRNILGVMLWSLKLRYWAWQVADAGPAADIQIFVLYYDPAEHPRLDHSLGLQKGLVGVVHAYAASQQSGMNQVIIAHELLHTLGATDKYDLATNVPLFPAGYADPGQQPLYPQSYAEIMAGRMAVSPAEIRQAENLGEVVIGEATALEINWIEN